MVVFVHVPKKISFHLNAIATTGQISLQQGVTSKRREYSVLRPCDPYLKSHCRGDGRALTSDTLNSSDLNKSVNLRTWITHMGYGDVGSQAKGRTSTKEEPSN